MMTGHFAPAPAAVVPLRSDPYTNLTRPHSSAAQKKKKIDGLIMKKENEEKLR